MATLYILEYHKRHTIHPHLAIGPHVGSTVVGTTGPGSGPYQYYNPTIYNHPNGSQMHPNPSQYSTGHMPHHPPPGQNAFDFATPAGQATVPIMNLAPPSVVDSKGHSNNNAISSISSQEKVPSSNRGKLINLVDDLCISLINLTHSFSLTLTYRQVAIQQWTGVKDGSTLHSCRFSVSVNYQCKF